MEDYYDVVLNFRERTDEAFFGVYDGHSGRLAAKFASKYVSGLIAGTSSADMSC